jgi:outer membrane protein assembly factor BamB
MLLPCLRRRVCLATAALPLALLASCASNESGSGSASAMDGQPAPSAAASRPAADRAERVRTLSTPFRELGWVLDWTVEMNAEPAVERIVPLDDLLLIQTTQNVVTVRDTGSGAMRWSQQIENPVANFMGHNRVDDVVFQPVGRPTAFRGDLLLSSTETEVFVRDMNTGTLLDRQRLRDTVSTAPALADDELVFGSLTGEVIFHDYMNGVYTNLFGMGSTVAAPPTLIAGEHLAIASDRGTVAIIDAETAEARGRRFSMFAGVEHPPATDDRTAYFASLDQSIYAFDVERSERRWRHRTDRPLRSAPAAHDGGVYIAVPESGLLALDSRTGDERWVATGLDEAVVIGTLFGELLAWDGRELVVLDERTGDVVSRTALPQVFRITPVGFENPLLYVEFRDGNLMRFRLPSGG